MSRNKLSFWSQLFSRQGYRCQLLPEDDSLTNAKLNIDLGRDYKGRPLILELKINSYLLPAELKDIEDNGNQFEEEQIFQLLVVLPFVVDSNMIGEVARLILLLNKPLDLPGFGFDEVTKVTFFRHNLIARKGQISSRLMLAVVGMIAFLVESLMPQIETVASGVSTKEMLTTYISRLTEVNLPQETDIRRAS